MLGMLYSEFQYQTPPPAYASLDHNQPQVVPHSQNPQFTTTIGSTADCDVDDDGDACVSVIHSNPPSYRSQTSRSCRRFASNDPVPPDYMAAVSTDQHTQTDDYNCDHHTLNAK